MLEFEVPSYVFLRSMLGTVTLATNHILLQFILISAYSLDGFAVSAEALVGLANGQKSRLKVRNSALKRTLWALFLAICMVVIFIIFGEKLISLMDKRWGSMNLSTKAFISDGYYSPHGSSLFYAWWYFIVATQTRFVRKATIQSFLVYSTFIAVLFLIFGNHGLWIFINIFFFAQIIFLLRYYPYLEKFK